MSNPQVLPVDREAAADLASIVYGARIAANIRDGSIEHHHFIDAFAKHRLSSSLQSVGEVERALKIERRLVKAYERDPMGTAHLCDEILDRSGNLLGWLRLATLKPSIEQD